MTLPNGVTAVKFRLQGELLRKRKGDKDTGLKLHEFTKGNERRVGFSWPNGQGLGISNPTGDQVNALWQYMNDNPVITGGMISAGINNDFLAYCKATYSASPGGA